MPNEFQDHQSIKEDAMNIELEPRPVSRPGITNEVHNNTAELGPPQADTDNGNDQTRIVSSQEPGSTDPGAQSFPGCPEQEAVGDIEPQSQPNQEDVDKNVHLTDLNDEIFLSKIRDLLISKLERSYENLVFRSVFHGLRWWDSGQIHAAWPASREVSGLRQYLIESDGVRIKTQVHWSSCWRPNLGDRDTPYDEIESVWLGWCCEARSKLQQVRLTRSYCYMWTDCNRKCLVRSTIHTQLRGKGPEGRLCR